MYRLTALYSFLELLSINTQDNEKGPSLSNLDFVSLLSSSDIKRYHKIPGKGEITGKLNIYIDSNF